jgi:Zn-dependent protease with chaperone function
MKLNNYLTSFFGVILILTSSYLFIAYRYFPLFIHRSVFFCQEIVKTLNLNISGEMGKIVISILFLGVFFVIFKILKTVLGYFAFKHAITKSRSLQPETLDHLLKRLDLSGKVVVIHQNKPQAFCFGILNSKIYLSTAMIDLMNISELEVILRHEQSHLTHKDSLTFFIATIIESIFPFFPILSDFVGTYRTEREIHADSVAVKSMSENNSITEVLKKILQYEPATRLAFIPDILAEDSLEARIQSLHGRKIYKNKINVKNLGLSIFSFLILVGLMANPVRAVDVHDKGGDSVILCADNDRSCAYACRDRALLNMSNYSSQQTSQRFSSPY